MTHRCNNKRCYVHSGESCFMGHFDYEHDCEHWKKNVKIDSKDEHGESPKLDGVGIPWSGNSLGSADLFHFLIRSRTIIVGILGAHGVGKTTFLQCLYGDILKGENIVEAGFAGSRTLNAWESIASWGRIDDAFKTATFPPHTSREINTRIAGLFHLSLRHDQKGFRDILLTDAPGDWFTSWSASENSDSAEGARWIVDNADAFLIFADCEKLSSDELCGTARREVRELIERLGKYVNDRPTLLVWAKSDHTPHAELKEAITKSITENIPLFFAAHTSTKSEGSFTKMLSHLLTEAWSPPKAVPIEVPENTTIPFISFRSRRK